MLLVCLINHIVKSRAGFTKCEAPVTRASAGPPDYYISLFDVPTFSASLRMCGPQSKARGGVRVGNVIKPGLKKTGFYYRVFSGFFKWFLKKPGFFRVF